MFFSHDALQAFGDRIALISEEGSTSYAELAGRARRFAQRLPQARGLIAVEMAPTPAAIAAYLGAWQAGHAVLPLPTGAPEQAEALVQRFRPAALWQAETDQLTLPCPAPAPVHPDLALLLMTSGSTGQGRGVRLSQRAVAANAASICSYLALDAAARAALVLPLHYSYGLSVLHSHLAVGASLWLSDGKILAEGFRDRLAAARCTSLAGVPHHFRLLETALGGADLPADLRCLTVAGGAMPAPEVQLWAARMADRRGEFVVMYGQTEATARIAYLPADRAATAPDAIGLAIPGGCLSLRDETGAVIETPEQEGELVYHGANVMMGYAEGAADLIRGQETEALATGDLAMRGADGLYRITGRRARISKIAGLRVGHDAMERALAEAGTEAAVWGDDSAIHVAVAAPVPGLQAQVARLAGLRAQSIVLHDCAQLPRHPNGKIDYPALRALCARPVAAAGADDLLSLFARTFAPDPVRPGDCFRDLGGDSLQHVELSLALDRHFGGLPENWEARSIADLAASAAPATPRLPMPLLARALAILAVVVAHQTHWPVYGGAAAMMILLGMSVAEHRARPLIEGDIAGFLSPLTRILLPYGLVLAGYALVWQQVPWASVALVGNLAFTSPETHLMLPYLYWFVEAYVQICLLLVLLCGPFGLRRLMARSLFASGLCLLALAMVLRLTLPEVWPLPAGRSQFSLPWVFYLFALGWCIAAAQDPRQRALVLVSAAVILPLMAWLGGNWYGSWSKYLSLLALTGLLLYLPAVRMPRVPMRACIHLAQAAFPIYLLHRLVPEVLLPALPPHLTAFLTPALLDLIAIVGGIALGAAAGVVLTAGGRALRQRPVDLWPLRRLKPRWG